MGNGQELVYRRSTRVEALRYAVVSVAFTIIASLALRYFVAAEEQVKNWIQYAIYGVSVMIWVIFVIPSFLKNGVFELVVDPEQLHCALPDGSEWAIKLIDIQRVEKRRRTTMSNTYVEYWVVEKEGKSHWVTPNFGLAPDTVLQALKRYLPGLEVVTTTTY